MKKSILISAITASLLFGTSMLQAETGETVSKSTNSEKQVKEENTNAADKVGNTYQVLKHKEHKASVNKEVDTQNKTLKPGSKEVASGLNETVAAIQALQKDDLDAAKKHLTEATKSFDSALKENPQLKLVPIASKIKIKELKSTPKEIEAAIALAKEALDNHQTQKARAILAPLEDDIITITQYIPMNLYPIATKNALEAVNKGDKKAALQILVEGLGTIVSTGILMPIPLLEAQLLIENASKLDKAKKEEAKVLLDAAKSELKKAMLLGYTDRHSDEYKALTEQIDAIEKEMKGENIVEKLYEKLKKSVESLVGKTRGEEMKDSVAAKEEKAIQNPANTNNHAESQSKVKEAQKKENKKAAEKIKTFENEAEKDKESAK